MLALYGHPFSSFTWKAQIALHAAGLDYEFRLVDPDNPEHGAFVMAEGGPWGKFPVLVDDDVVLFESTAIIEHLASRHPALLPAGEAPWLRTLDRVFDNYVMAPMQAVVNEYLRAPEQPDAARCAEAQAGLQRSYLWLEDRLPLHAAGRITLVECAAAPALFYADWVEPIGADCPKLAAWRGELLALPEVARCVDAARPFRAYFPPGAPDRD